MPIGDTPVRKISRASEGLSYFDANSQRLITIEDDVLGIKNQITKTWPQLAIYFDSWDEEWVITEHCVDGEERFVLSTKTLDQRVVDRLHRADGATGVDFLYEIEKEEARDREAKRKQLLDQVGDAAERLHSAMQQDGIINRPSIFIGGEYAAIRDENRA